MAPVFPAKEEMMDNAQFVTLDGVRTRYFEAGKGDDRGAMEHVRTRQPAARHFRLREQEVLSREEEQPLVLSALISV